MDPELHIAECYHGSMGTILKITQEPKTFEVEKRDDGRYRLLITVKKLGAFTAVEFFLNLDEAQQLREALKTT